MEKTKLLTGFVIVLIAVNAATLAFIWLQRPAQPQGRRPERDPGEVLSQQLGFSREQKLAFDTLRARHHSQMMALGDSLKSMKEALFQSILSGDTLRARAIIFSIGTVHQQVELVTFDHFSGVRRLLTPEQRVKYDGMLHRAITEGPGQPKGDDRRPPPGRGEGPPGQGRPRPPAEGK